MVDKYYRATYQKFRAFLLTEYDRVVVMDADGFALKNLDHLFLLKFPGEVKLAAPQQYWAEDFGVRLAWQAGCKGILRRVLQI